MADLKISALPAVTTPASTDEFPVNQGGTTKKQTRAQIHALESGEHLVLPQVNEVATPTLEFGASSGDGFYASSSGTIRCAIGGVSRWFVNSAWLVLAEAWSSGRPGLANVNTTATVPTLIPSGDDNDTGIGQAADDALSLIAGGVEIGRHQVTKTIAAVTFSGSGLDDATSGGTFTGGVDADYVVNIDATGTPDTFEWSRDGGSTQEATGVAIVGGAMTLDTGVTITFAATTGHTVNDNWSFAAEVNTQIIIDPGQNFRSSIGTSFPSLAFGDGNTGFYESSDNVFNFVVGGVLRGVYTLTGWVSGVTSGPQVRYETTSATNPVFIPRMFDDDSGIGSAAADALSLIAGAIEGIRLTEIGDHIIQKHEAQVGITAHTGSSQGDGPILSTYNVYDTVGSAGDAATLPDTFGVGTKIVVVNNAASNSMDVFPTSGDDAGLGTDTVVPVLAGESVEFLAITADATWVIVRNS